MMPTRVLCREESGALEFEARVVGVRGVVVVLDQTAFYPTGGGQPCDLGVLELDGRAYTVAEVRAAEGGLVEHVLAEAPPPGVAGAVGRVDGARREAHRRLHTGLHILTAVVAARFEGARVTGAQIHPDGTARMDFALPEVQNAELRGLETVVNQHIREDRAVRARYLPSAEALQVPGVVRTLNRDIPPSADGRVRLVEIEGLDLQACGGTHVASTARCGSLAFTKIDNKGRQNRRVAVRLA